MEIGIQDGRHGGTGRKTTTCMIQDGGKTQAMNIMKKDKINVTIGIVRGNSRRRIIVKTRGDLLVHLNNNEPQLGIMIQGEEAIGMIVETVTQVVGPTGTKTGMIGNHLANNGGPRGMTGTKMAEEPIVQTLTSLQRRNGGKTGYSRDIFVE